MWGVWAISGFLSVFVTRNVLEQCPQMTLMPTGWCCGSGLSLPMWTGPRLMMRLLPLKKKKTKKLQSNYRSYRKNCIISKQNQHRLITACHQHRRHDYEPELTWLKSVKSHTCFFLLPVRPWTGDPLRCDFADQETVTRTANVLLSNGSVLNRLRAEKWRQACWKR